MANIIVEEKIENVALESAKNLNGNDDLKNEIKSEIRKIINQEEIKTNNQEINDLEAAILKKIGIENNDAKIEAKKIWIEIDRWKNEKVKDIEDFKKEEFKNKFVEETKKLNPDLKEDQIDSVKKYAEEISDIYAKNNEIDACKNEALEANSQLSPGQLQNGFTDLKGTLEFLKKSPLEIKEKIETVKSIKEKIKDVKLPNLKELRSFENITAILGKDGGNDLFSKTQKYLGWADKVNKLTGGRLNKIVINAGMKMVSKIGNQAVQEFATNALNVMAKEGFQKGFSTVLNGVLSGGVKAAGTTAATGAAATGATATGATAAAAAGLSATGVGAIVVAAAAALKVIKDVTGKIAEKLGIDTKQFFEEKFGKVGGFFVKQTVKITTITTVSLIPIIVVGLIIFLFINVISTGFSVSSLVPPESGVEISETLYDETYIPSDEPIVLPGVVSGQKPTGQMIVDMARSLSGKVCYYWGGKSNIIGIDPKWGQKITPDGTDKERDIAGLDCSGFVNWVYYQYGYSFVYIRDMYEKNIPISEENLQPGDIGIEGYEKYKSAVEEKEKTLGRDLTQEEKDDLISTVGWHVGIFTGRDVNREAMWIHSGSTTKSLGVCKAGFVAETHYYKFTKFARIL